MYYGGLRKARTYVRQWLKEAKGDDSGQIYQEEGKWRLKTISDKTVWFDSKKEALEYWQDKTKLSRDPERGPE